MFSWLRRTWQLALLAKSMIAVRMRRGTSTAQRARARSVKQLGKMHGLPQKIGQLLALSELDDPATFTPLTESCSARPARKMFPVMERSLGRKWTECFRWIDPVGIAASIGQVHRAILHDGRTVAVKIQYPDCVANAETDLKALHWLTLPFGGLGRGFDLSAYRTEIHDMLRQELDYCREAQSIQTFGELARGLDWLRVPTLIPELSTDRVVTMTWVDGVNLPVVCRWPEAERRQVARQVLRLFLTSCFRWRCLHADPHPGNYRFERTGQGVRLGLLDFGCVQNLDDDFVRLLTGLIDTARNSANSVELSSHVLSSFVALGFRADLLEPMAHLLPELNRILFEPFATPGDYDPSRWNIGARVEKVLGPYRWNFRFAGPARLILFVRGFIGLIRYQQALKVAIDWSRIWDEIRIESEQTMPALTVAAKPDARVVRSSRLRVRVEDAGQVKVDLTMRAAAAEFLADLVPEDLVEKLQARSIDVNKIAAQSIEKEFAPGELFVLSEGTKRVSVWLE
jgi:predicted unusual protein kinase regulating ubiquinone biosynthesis (AarF/ABC1/UbiB family)